MTNTELSRATLE